MKRNLALRPLLPALSFLVPGQKLPDLFTELFQDKGADLQSAMLPGCTVPLQRLSYGLQGLVSLK